MPKKRPDGTEVWVPEHRMGDERLSSRDYIRRNGLQHYTLLQCQGPACGVMIPASSARVFTCDYLEPGTKARMHGELAFCSYGCILAWLPRWQITGKDH